jgi:hypothetical protein
MLFYKKIESNIKSNFLIYTTLGLLIGLWFQTIAIPYWWDSAGLIITGAQKLIETNSWPFFVGLEGAYAHPTLFITIVALSWKIFGHTLLTSHFINLIFAAVAVLYTYKLARDLIKDSKPAKLVGASSAILLLLTPVFYAQLGIIYLEIPVCAMALMTIYYFFKKSFIKYFLAASIMLLIKEVSVVVILAILITIFLKFINSKEKNLKFFLKESVLYSLPLSALLAWFIYHKNSAGFWYIPPGIQRAFDMDMALKNLWLVVKFLIIEQWRFVFTMLILYFAQDVYFKKEMRKEVEIYKILPFAFVIVLSVLLFGFSDFLPRYVIFILPFYYLLSLYFLTLLLKKLKFENFAVVILAFTIGLSFFFYSNWDLHRQINSWYFPPLEDNLEYLDVIALTKQTSNYIAMNFPDKQVYTTFPNNLALSHTYQGYITNPISVKECRDYQEGSNVDLMVFHFFSPQQQFCARLTQIIKFEKALKFEKNGKVMYLYINGVPNATPSAKIQNN